MDKTEIGMTLDDIDKIVHDYIIADDAYPSAIDFHQFPKSVCTSINDVVSHGVPNNYILKNGDYVNIDVVCFDGKNNSWICIFGIGNEALQTKLFMDLDTIYSTDL